MPPILFNVVCYFFVYIPLSHVSVSDCDIFSNSLNYPLIPCDFCFSQFCLRVQHLYSFLFVCSHNSPGIRPVLFMCLSYSPPFLKNVHVACYFINHVYFSIRSIEFVGHSQHFVWGNECCSSKISLLTTNNPDK